MQQVLIINHVDPVIIGRSLGRVMNLRWYILMVAVTIQRIFHKEGIRSRLIGRGRSTKRNEVTLIIGDEIFGMERLMIALLLNLLVQFHFLISVQRLRVITNYISSTADLTINLRLLLLLSVFPFFFIFWY